MTRWKCGEICRRNAMQWGVEEWQNLQSTRALASQAIVAKYLLAWMPRPKIQHANPSRYCTIPMSNSFKRISISSFQTKNQEIVSDEPENRMLTYLPVFSRGRSRNFSKSLSTPCRLSYLAESKLPTISRRSSAQCLRIL